MLDNFIRGGQLFLHNITMFKQVLGRTLLFSVIIAIAATCYMSFDKVIALDYRACITYMKANTTQAIYDHRIVLSKQALGAVARVDAYDHKGLYKKEAVANDIMRNPIFKKAYAKMWELVYEVILLTLGISLGFMSIIFLLWSKFGKNAKATKILRGDKVYTAKEVAAYLKAEKKNSDLIIGEMPLVKDQETKHILVTGATGSGKTNLINTLLPQVRKKKQPALVVDQTGEMIARYYDKARGDIIFNPFDERGTVWDFFGDCSPDYINNTQSDGHNKYEDIYEHNSIAGINDRLEKFAKILFGFNKKSGNGASSDPFWENSAETVFCAIVEYLLKDKDRSYKKLKQMLSESSLNDLTKALKGTKASRYLDGLNKVTASSILSVLATSTKPLNYLYDHHNHFDKDNNFKESSSINDIRGSINNANTSPKNILSLKEYFKGVAEGKEAWLFLATSPSQRELTLPLIACMLELSVSLLMESGINPKRRIWFPVDELAALGKLPATATLMAEGRKYGACIVAGIQSVNQLFNNYGHYAGSTLFGQFGTKFVFRYSEPSTLKMFSELFGAVEYKEQQKNTSYGAHEHRDGIRYTEQERKKALVMPDDIASLKTHECYVELPEPLVRIAKIVLPISNVKVRNKEFIKLTNTLTNTREYMYSSTIDIEDQNVEAHEKNNDTEVSSRSTIYATENYQYTEQGDDTIKSINRNHKSHKSKEEKDLDESIQNIFNKNI